MSEEIFEKTCTGPCGRTLPLTSFNDQVGGKYDKRADCKFCQNIRHREHHRANPEIRNGYYRNRRRGPHGDAMRAKDKLRREANPERHRELTKNWRDKLRIDVITAYGGFCQCCGITEICFLTLDHVAQDGAEHRKQIGAQRAWTVLYQWAKANGYPPSLRVLCWNCNNAAFRNNGICPHQETRLAIAA